MRRIIAIYGDFWGCNESSLNILKEIICSSQKDCFTFDYNNFKRDGIGEYLQSELSDNYLKDSNGNFQESYHVLVEVMLRLAEAYYDQIKGLVPHLEGRGVIVINGGAEKTLSYLLGLMIDAYPDRDFTEMYNWLDKISDFKICPDLSICLNLNNESKYHKVDLGNSFKLMKQFNNNIFIPEKLNDFEALKDLIQKRINELI